MLNNECQILDNTEKEKYDINSVEGIDTSFELFTILDADVQLKNVYNGGVSIRRDRFHLVWFGMKNIFHLVCPDTDHAGHILSKRVNVLNYYTEV